MNVCMKNSNHRYFTLIVKKNKDFEIFVIMDWLYTVNDQLSAPARLAAPAQISAPSE